MVLWKKYILWFAQEHVDFRKAEILSLVKLFKLQIKNMPEDSMAMTPFWIVELPDEQTAKKLASRSVSLRCILELWSHSHKIPQFHENLKKYIEIHSSSVEKYFEKDKTFKITVETYNKHFTQSEKIRKIETFDYFPVSGKVKLKCPDIEWWYIEFYGLNPQEVPNEPYDVIFGRWIVDGQRNLIKELSLKERKFIGNTSMDAQLSIFMANQAIVKEGDFVYDPFVGTGSLLVSAAKFGAYVIGSDIDYMTLHAKSRPSRITQKIRDEDESVRMNLKQYGCEKYYIDVIISDFSNPIWNDNIQFDSIITDPPYGIREATEKISTKPLQQRSNDIPHYPSTSHYSLEKLFFDLLIFSAKHLKIGGRLVCWFPIYREDYNENIIPKHKCLKLISNSEQILSSLTSRRLLTYEKVLEYDSNTLDEAEVSFTDFRTKYFADRDETRKERRLKKAELREIGRQEAIKRGKILDINGKVVNKI